MTAGYAPILGYFLRAQPEPGDPSGIDSCAFFRLARLLPCNLFGSSLMTGMGSIVKAGTLVTGV